MKRILFLLLWAAASRSEAFNANYNASGNVQHWTFVTPDPSLNTNSFNTNTHAIRFYLATDGFSATNTAAELNAVRNSFGQWQSVLNSVVKFEEAGLVAPGYTVKTTDGSNVVFWAKSSTTISVDGGFDNISGALGVTYTTFSVTGNVLKQFDIVINGVEDGWFTDFNDKNNTNYFVEGTLTHEIGHALGMEHSSMGGATMLYAGNKGVDGQAGLSEDEIAFARTLYPSNNILSTLGHLKGNVTKNGSPVLGAAIILENTNGLLVGSTVSLANGSYALNAIPAGGYNIRIIPLDSTSASGWLIRGPDISADYNSADTTFLPIGNSSVTLAASVANTVNFAVTNGDPAFRITYIRKPSSSSGSYSINQLPVTMSPGQSNYFISVFSSNLPTNGATFTISGDGLTLGSPTYQPGNVFSGLNGISASVSVASNATPGLRTLSVVQGTNFALANGYLEILPTSYDYNFDGLDDTFQRQYFFPFTSSNASPNADPDGDRMNNFAEFISGTVPTNAASLLKMLNVVVTGTGTTSVWQSVVGKRYQVSSSTNLAGSVWQNVGSVTTAISTNSQIFDTSGTNNSRFYRVQVLP
jgi:hypothetical protein